MSRGQTKTDNHNPGAKLALRRYFLRRYHGTGDIRVLDCCQGSARIWSRLRTEFTLASYWGVDVKPLRGRLSLESQRILGQPGWRENVVDVDTYGSPWKHWFAILTNCDHDVTVFLTIGQWQIGADKLILRALDLGDLKIPPGIAVKLHDSGTDGCIASVSQFGFKISEAAEADNPHGNARYIGVRLVKTDTPNASG